MKILVTTMVLAALAASVQAATMPGTVICTSASATYKDSSGQTMPQTASNEENVLVVSSQPDRTVMLTVHSLYFGPSTVGRTVKVAGRVFADTNGVWLDDGSALVEVDAAGNEFGTPLYCKLSTTFLSQAPAGNTMTIITGVSQLDNNDVPMIIPASDAQIQSVTP